MKKTEKILVVVMVMAIALSLCGCGNTAKKLYGTWERNDDLSYMLEKNKEEEFGDFHEKFIVVTFLHFNEDGTFEMYVNKDQVTESLNNYLKSMASFGTNIMYEQMEEAGIEREWLDEYIEEQFGMSVEEYMLEELKNQISADRLIEKVEMEGIYEAKGKRLYMDEYEISPNAYDIFTVEGDTLTIDAATEEIAEDEELIEGFTYPYVFTRVVE